MTWVTVPIRMCHFQDPTSRDKLQEPGVGRCHLLLEPEVRGALGPRELIELPLSNGISVASATSYKLNGLENSKSILRTMLSIYKLLGAHPREAIAVPFCKSPFTSWELSSFLRGQWDKTWTVADAISSLSYPARLTLWGPRKDAPPPLSLHWPETFHIKVERADYMGLHLFLNSPTPLLLHNPRLFNLSAACWFSRFLFPVLIFFQ